MDQKYKVQFEIHRNVNWHEHWKKHWSCVHNIKILKTRQFLEITNMLLEFYNRMESKFLLNTFNTSHNLTTCSEVWNSFSTSILRTKC